MTKKEMRNLISELNQRVTKKGTMEQRKEYIELSNEMMRQSGHYQRYCRYWLRTDSRKEEIESYLNCHMIAIDILGL